MESGSRWRSMATSDTHPCSRAAVSQSGRSAEHGAGSRQARQRPPRSHLLVQSAPQLQAVPLLGLVGRCCAGLLCALLANTGKVMTQRHLLREVWGAASVESNHYLRVYVGHLRQKLEDDPTQPKYLLTETGVGYRFQP